MVWLLVDTLWISKYIGAGIAYVDHTIVQQLDGWINHPRHTILNLDYKFLMG